MTYAELNITSNFSFLRGASHAEELAGQAKALGLAAIAVTDRNTLAGVVRAHIAAKDANLRLVIGVRLDLEDAPSLLCYPTDRKAYGRLCRLLSLGQGRAEKGKCQLFLADVATYAQGCIFIALPPENWDWREASRATDTRSLAVAEIIPFQHALQRGALACSSDAVGDPGSRLCASSLRDAAAAGMTEEDAASADSTIPCHPSRVGPPQTVTPHP
ncbi:MAG: PHP domain-containing protein, partial [Hyphomicrobium sp.]|nr:PHP domain-containing protein [Hyphomicrobium sp.]